ncbi:DoxX family protein [Pedococcus bigeumensis]|uniref:DoxX family membrane protein n=1 Tax=Pedococcus bigeumensis TaxID=433644 RepID=A0A502D029_9MICO|nr:DoxX family membrane protein [Pedococcus bigeumensis]TPG18130.1 DoxX family membrane protein [Pedococcus bigeumensis]
MSTIVRSHTDQESGTTSQPQVATSGATGASRALPYVLGAIRLSLGWVFLWAFLDKVFGLGHGTPSKGAWINGGHPTMGFLKNAAAGPFADFYHGIAGAAWADSLFMLGLLGIGVALIAGVAMRFAAFAGALLLVLMWTAVLPPESNLFMDDHLIYAMTLVALMLLGAGKYLGFGQRWERLSIVRRYAFLR